MSLHNFFDIKFGRVAHIVCTKCRCIRCVGVHGGYKMMENVSPIHEMSLDELFASARAMGRMREMKSITLHFQLTGCDVERGVLTVSRNPAATRWLTTVGIVQGERCYARMTHGDTANEALTKIERYCHWWLGQ